MKKSIIAIGIGITTFLSILVSCSESLQDTYSEFTENGETIYIGAPVSISAISTGINTMKLSIVINADPKISKGTILDTEGAIISEFDINLASLVDNTVEVDVNLNEGDNTIFVVLKDNSGNESVKKEALIKVFGTNYQAGLISRIIATVTAISPNAAIIQWDAVQAGSISTILTYEDSSGVLQTMEIANDINETALDDIKLGGSISVSSTYKPSEDATFVFESLPSDYTFPLEFLVDKSGISQLILPFDAGPAGCWDSSFDFLLDGEVGRYWHSCDADDFYPFVMTLDMGQEISLSKFKLDRRASCCQDRSPAEMQFWGTNDITLGETTINLKQFDEDGNLVEKEIYLPAWEADATAKGWVKLGGFTDNTDETVTKELSASAEKYRYVRLVFISSIGGGDTANFDELTFWSE